jgi:hypothetical protein
MRAQLTGEEMGWGWGAVGWGWGWGAEGLVVVVVVLLMVVVVVLMDWGWAMWQSAVGTAGLQRVASGQQQAASADLVTGC